MSRITFKLANGGRPKQVEIVVAGGTHSYTRSGQAPLFITPQPGYNGQRLNVYADEGYWGMTIDPQLILTNRDFEVRFTPLPTAGPIGWWHALHNIGAGVQMRGERMRIGVINEGLADQDATSCIHHVKNLGSIAWDRNSKRSHSPRTRHGQAVCSILSSRALVNQGYEGIVPGAKVFFCGAGSDGSSALDRSRVIFCIDYLINECQCDIISVSAGDDLLPMDDLRDTVEGAADQGVLCFFAAGNQGAPRYPALYPACLSVAALGRRNQAPPGSVVELLDQHHGNRTLNHDVYLWAASARGPEVEFCAPGVGVVWSSQGRSFLASSGTSFACPVAVGAAAILLERDPHFRHTPRDRRRWDYATQVLSAACRPVGTSVVQTTLWKYGRMWVP